MFSIPSGRHHISKQGEMCWKNEVWPSLFLTHFEVFGYGMKHFLLNQMHIFGENWVSRPKRVSGSVPHRTMLTNLTTRLRYLSTFNSQLNMFDNISNILSKSSDLYTHCCCFLNPSGSNVILHKIVTNIIQQVCYSEVLFSDVIRYNEWFHLVFTFCLALHF